MGKRKLMEHRCGGRWGNKYRWWTKTEKTPVSCPRCRAYLKPSNSKIIKEEG